MRVIAGELKGKKLFSIKGLSLRPTSDRVREAIFNILQARVKGKKVLDLFAGTGALGIEALSRGAKKVVFVENNRRILLALKRNIKECRLEEKAEVLPCEIKKGIKILKARGEVFDLIFMDPPYGRGLVKETLKELEGSTLIGPKTLIIVEHSLQEELPNSFSWRIEDRRKYGLTCISFLQWVQGEESSQDA